MAKRITESRLKKALIAGGIVGVPIGIFLLAYLASIGAVEVISYSGDIFSDEETVFINITFKANEDIFIYPMDPKFKFELETTNKDAIKLIKMYRTWGKGLREIKMNETCKGTWCGGKSGIESAYVFAFREGRTYTLVYEIQKDSMASLKWSWLEGTVDPAIIGYSKIYTKKIEYTKSIDNVKTQIPCDNVFDSGTEKCSICLTNFKCINRQVCDSDYCYDLDCDYELFKKVSQSMCFEKDVKRIIYTPYEVDNEYIGNIINQKYYKNSHIIKDRVFVWKIPIGDRNFEEYGFCRPYEIQKGVCEEITDNIISAVII